MALETDDEFRERIRNEIIERFNKIGPPDDEGAKRTADLNVEEWMQQRTKRRNCVNCGRLMSFWGLVGNASKEPCFKFDDIETIDKWWNDSRVEIACCDCMGLLKTLFGPPDVIGELV